MVSSSLVWITLILLVLVALIAYAVISVRRARREHKARSEERAAAMLLALQQSTLLARPAAAPGAANTGISRPSASPLPATAPAALARRPRIMTDTQRLLYLVLRSALPDHIIMANMRIVDLVDLPVEAAAPARQPRLEALLRERADCIVCDSDLVPVAALVVYPAGLQALPDERIKVDALREMGVKFLRFRADNLPRPAEMRALVIG